MKRYAMIFILLIGILFLRTPYTLAEGEGRVVIKSPKQGETLKDFIIQVELEIDKGQRGDHVHLFVDGNFEAIVKGEGYTMKGLPKGERRIDARLATKGHKELGPEATVTFTIE